MLEPLFDWLMRWIGYSANVIALWQFVRDRLPSFKTKPRSERISEDVSIEIEEPNGRKIRIATKTRINRG